MQIAGRVLNLGLGVVATALLARSLGEESFGRWTTIFLVTGLVGYFNELGLQQVAIQKATAERDPSWIGALIGLRLALSIPTAILAAVITVSIADESSMRVAAIIACAALLLVGPQSLATVYQVRVRNDIPTAVMTFNNVLWTISVVILASAGAGLVTFTAVFVAVATVTATLQAVLALRMMRVPVAASRHRWRELLRVGVPVSISTLLIFSYSRIDGVIVYELAGAAEAGFYGAAYRILEQSHFLPLSLMTTLLPLIATAHVQEPARLRRYLQNALDLMAMASLPALAFALVASGPLIDFIFTDRYAAAAEALPILMAAFIFICCGYAFGAFVLVLGLQRRFVIFALAALVVNLAINLVFVPRYGFVAAAWATLITEVVVVGLAGRAVLGSLGMRLSLGRIARAALAAAVMALVVLGLVAVGVPVPALLVVAAVVHTAGLFATRALRPADLRELMVKPAAS